MKRNLTIFMRGEGITAPLYSACYETAAGSWICHDAVSKTRRSAWAGQSWVFLEVD